MKGRVLLVFALLTCGAPFVGCNAPTAPATELRADAGDGAGPSPAPSGSPRDDAGTAKEDAGGPPDGRAPSPSSVGRLRVVAGNLSSGTKQSYDPGDGIRILRGLAPDVALLQEVNYGAGAEADVRKLVDEAFGPDFSVHRESGVQIPNAVISRFPIAQSGSWTDPQVTNRSFVWAKLDVPGDRPLWAVSLHLLTSGASERSREAASLVAQVTAMVPKGDYLVVGGDLNTDSRTEACIGTLSAIVVTAGPPPDDGNGNANTSSTRSKPYDWVLPGPDLARLEVPVRIGDRAFPSGLVFDSRVFSPLADVVPVTERDCAAANMQHMAVVKDFQLP